MRTQADHPGHSNVWHRSALNASLEPLEPRLLLSDGLGASLGSIVRLNVGADGHESLEYTQALTGSPDGSYVAFISGDDTLVPGDTHLGADIFVRSSNGLERVVVLGTDGQEPQLSTWQLSLSNNAQYIAFASSAPNLVAGDTNSGQDVFVLNRATGDIERVSVSTQGDQATVSEGEYLSMGEPSITPDGRYVLFASTASNLAPGERTQSLYVRDRQNDTTTAIPVPATLSDLPLKRLQSASMSADGRYVAFAAQAGTDWGPNGEWPEGVQGLFVYDRQSDTLTRLNPNAQVKVGQEGEGSGGGMMISGDGNYVAFTSSETDLVAGDTNQLSDVFLYDRQIGMTRRINLAADGSTQANGGSSYLSISSEGRYVAYSSGATNLAAGVTVEEGGYASNIFLCDTVANSTTLVSVGADGLSAGSECWSPQVGPGGRVVLFQSWASNLVPDDTNSQSDAFAWFSMESAAGPYVTSQSPALSAAGAVSSLTINFSSNINPDSFSPADDVQLAGVSGAVPITDFHWADPRQLVLEFEQRTAGRYSFTIGPNIEDLSGNLMDQDGDGTAEGGQADAYRSSFSIAIDCPRVTSSYPTGPQGTGVNTATVYFNEAIDPASFDSVADIYLESPSQQRITITSFTWWGTNTLQLYFNALTALGTYTMQVGPHIQNAAGNAMDQNRNLIPGEDPGDQYSASFLVHQPYARVWRDYYTRENNGPVSQLELDFSQAMDTTSFSIADDVVSFTSPGGTPIGITSFEWRNNQALLLNFPGQIIPGSYVMVIGPNVLDAYGTPMDQNSNNVPGQASDQWTSTIQIASIYPQITAMYPNTPATGPVSQVTLYFSKAMDTTSFSLADDVVSFAGPGGAPIVISDFQWAGSQTLMLNFPSQAVNGSYQLVLGPNILDSLGNALDQNNNVTPGEVTDGYTGTFTVAIPAPYVTGQSPTGTLSQPVSAIVLTFSESMNTTSFNVADDIASFTGPAGAGVSAGSITSFQWIDGHTLSLAVGPLVYNGSYSLALNTTVLDTFGHPLDQNRNGTPGEAGDGYTATFSVSIPYATITAGLPAGTVTAPVQEIRFTFSRDMDAAGFSIADDVVSFTGPAGAGISVGSITGFSWIDARTLALSVASQTADGAYQLVLGPGILDSFGRPMDQDGDGTPGEATQDRYTAGYTIDIGYPQVTGHSPNDKSQAPVSTLTLTFSRAMDPASFDPAADIVSFHGPRNAPIAVSGSRWVDASTLELSFAEQTANGHYALILGPGVLDTYGRPLDQSGNDVGGEATADRYVAAFMVDLGGPRVVAQEPSGTVTQGISSMTLTFNQDIDPASFSVAADVVSFTNPLGAAIAITSTNWVDPATLQLNFAEQLASGTYWLVIGPDIRDTVDNQMDQNANGTKGEALADRYTATFDLQAPPYVLSQTPTGDVPGPVSHVQVTFSEPMNGATFTTADVTITGPNGAVTPSGVASADGNSYTVSFPAQNTAGTYHVYVGPNIENARGANMDQNHNGVVAEAIADRYDATFNLIDITGPRITGVDPAGPTTESLDHLTVTFSEPITASTFTAADVTLTGPAGAIAVSGIVSAGGNAYRINFPIQRAAGTYHLVVGPNIGDVPGNLMDQNQNGTKGEAQDDRFVADVVVDKTGPHVASNSIPAVVNAPATQFDLTFNEAILEASLTAAAVTVTGPDGANQATQITRLSATQYRVTFPATAKEGTYIVAVSPTMTDLAGNKLDQNANGVAGEAAGDAYTFQFTQALPDLVITQILTPAEAVGGTSLDVTYTVTNRGQGAASGTWFDSIRLSSDATIGSDTEMTDLMFTQPLGPGESVTRVATFTVPLIEGNRWIVVSADKWSQLAEADEANNATIRPTAVWVTARPYADLQVSQVDAPDPLKAGDLATISWTVLNAGNGPTSSRGWTDKLYLSTDRTFDASDILLGSLASSEPLGNGESYTRTLEVTVPDSVPRAEFYVLAVADANDQEEEFNFEGNNAGATLASSDVVTPEPGVITVVDIVVPALIEPSTHPTFSWTVTNTGGRTLRTGLYGSAWDDALALWPVPVADPATAEPPIYNEAQVYWLGSHMYNWSTPLPLRPGQSYNNYGSPEHAIPAWAPGTYWIFVIPDTHFSADLPPGTGWGGSTVARTPMAVLVTLGYAQPSDLTATGVTVPATAVSGQTLTAGWTITNNGLGDTKVDSWTDKVVLSRNTSFGDGDDIPLVELPHNGVLEAGASYRQDGRTFNLPNGLSGDYYVLVMPDSTNAVYESDENNNVGVSAAVPITLVQSNLVPALSGVTTTGRSGETMRVTWTVQNTGPDTTSASTWTDTIYLTQDFASFDRNDPLTCTLLRSFPHTGALAGGGSYDQDQQVTLPTGVEGAYFVVVVTDTGNDLYEHNGENDNVSRSNGPVAFTDPAPDLVAPAASLTVSATSIVAGKTINVGWLVRNDGTKAATAPWTDGIYLSADTTFDPATDTLLWSAQHAADLAIGASYGTGTSPITVTVPDGNDGTFYLFFATDSGSAVYEKGSDANNAARSGAITVTDLKADLQVTRATAPLTAGAGRLIDVDYTIANRGKEGALGTWFDAFYLSADATFDPDTDVLMGIFTHTGPLAVGKTYSAVKPAQVRLPDRIDGTYSIFCVPDYTNAVPESGEDNAFLLAKGIAVTYDPADLQVASVTSPAAATAGSVVTVTWTVANRGPAATAESVWQDGIYLSDDSTFDPASDVELGLIQHSGVLQSGSSYTVTQTLPLRQDLEGYYHVYVYSDVRHQVFEFNLEGNNVTESPRLLSVAGVHADLQASAVSAVPPAFNSGGTTTVSWTVSNAGRDTTAATEWYDVVYASADATLSADDPELLRLRHSGALAAGGSYTASRDATLPPGLSGSMYILVKADSGATNAVYEYEAEDNNVASTAVTVTPIPPADLQVTAIDAPATAWSGQNIHVEWTVTNAGGSTAQALNGWSDSVYLSRDPYCDPGTDILLGSVFYRGTLAIAASYGAPQSLDARLPAGASGPYYVIVVTDTPNRVYEGPLEGNNTTATAAAIQVNLTPPADLIVTDVTPPGSAVYGQPATFSFTVANRDTLDAFGGWYDSVYLSTDAAWDVGDIRVARVRHDGTVPHAADYTQTVTANMPGVMPGSYYLIVRTDILNELREIDETNNIGVSTDPFVVDGQPLTLGAPAGGTITSGQSAYYQVSVGAGEDLLLSLAGAAAGSCELYMAQGYIPTRSVYDARGGSAAGSQQIRIRGTAGGTYYILAYDRQGAANAYTLTASVLPSGITGASPSTGGNTGRVTIFVQGSSLPLAPRAALVAAGGKTLPASHVWAGDNSGFYATFNLTGEAPGVYALDVTGPAGQFIHKADAFTVTAGGAANFESSLSVPSVIRPGAPFIMTVHYANTGTVDMASPLLSITGPASLSVGLEPNNPLAQETIGFVAYSPTGPGGILRPGESVDLDLYGSGVAAGSYTYTLKSLGADTSLTTPTPIDWAALESQYRPPYLTDAQWAPVWEAFRREIGSSWVEVGQRLAEQVSRMPPENIPNILLDDLMNQAFRELTGPNGGGLLDHTAPRITAHWVDTPTAGTANGVELLFSEAIDAASFALGDVTMTGPGGVVIAPSSITAVSDRIFRVAFPLQTTTGLYRMLVGPNIVDKVGQALDQDIDGRFGEATDDQYAAVFRLGSGAAAPSDAYIASTSPSGQVEQAQGLDRLIVNLNRSVQFLTFTKSDVSLLGPDDQGNPTVPLAITDVTRLTSTQYLVTFPHQNKVGTYRLTVGEGVQDLSGQAMEPLAVDVQIVDHHGPSVEDATPAGYVSAPVSFIEVTFDETIRLDSFTAADVTITGPGGGAVAVTGVSPVSGARVFHITFADQTGPGKYTFTIGPDVLDASRNAMDQDGNGTNGEADDVYEGSFEILPPGLHVSGRITYGGTLAGYFPDGAHVAVQLWEQNGARDAVPGADDDQLISDWNLLSGKGATEYGCDFVDEEGYYLFSYDRFGDPILNGDTGVGEEGTARDVYVVVLAKNEYATVADETTLTNALPGDDSRFLYTSSRANGAAGALAFQTIGGTDRNFARIYTATTATTTPPLGTADQTVTLDATVNDDRMGLAEWVRYGAKWVENNVGEPACDPIVVLAPWTIMAGATPKNAQESDQPGLMYIVVGADFVSDPGIVLHEYGHALQVHMNGGNPTPYAKDRYGVMQESDTEVTPLAEGWASFFAAKTLENANAGGLMTTLSANRARYLETNDFWMGYDAYGYTANSDAGARDTTLNIGGFTGINKKANTGRNVMGAVMSIFWDIADNDAEDNVFDIKGLWSAMKTASAGAGTIDAFYDAFKAATSAAERDVNAIFIDHGIPVTDDAGAPNDTEDYAEELPLPPVDIKDLIVAEEAAGAGDWFTITLPALESHAAQAKGYSLVIGIDFLGKRYGDLDLIVKLTGGGKNIKEQYIRRGSDREQTTIGGLDNAHEYTLTIGVLGHGAMIPSPGDPWAFLEYGGDYNPQCELYVHGKIPPPEPDKPEDKKPQSTAGAHDPNDKIGPDGYGPEKYVTEDSAFPYTIRFENDAKAEASCVLVTVIDPLNANLDWSTFELGNISFNNRTITVPARSTYYETVVDMRTATGDSAIDAPNNILVDVVANFDLVTGLASWTFTGLDPATGEPTMDPLVGFLPPNNLGNHEGDGFVKFNILPLAGLESGDEITNQATIVFDWNEPMDTPLVKNTIDSAAPASQVIPLPAEIHTPRIPVTWSGSDEAEGSGLHSFDVYVAVDGGDYSPWLTDTTSTSAVYAGQIGHQYGFYSVARDNVGHDEAAPSLSSHAVNRLQELYPVGADTTTSLTADIFYVGNDPRADKKGYTWADPADNDTVTATLTGRNGYAALYFDGGILYGVELRGTDALSTLAFKVKKAPAGNGLFGLGEILSSGPAALGTLDASAAVWTGAGIDIQGPVKTVKLGNVPDDVDLLFGGRATDKMTLTAGNVGNGVDFAFGGTVTTATVNAWLGGSVLAGGLGTWTVKAGDFGPAVTAGLAGIASLKITGGDLLGSVDSAGIIKSISVLAAKGGAGGDIASPRIHSGSSIDKITTSGGGLSSAVDAAKVGTIDIRGGSLTGSITTSAAQAALKALPGIASVSVTGGDFTGSVLSAAAIGKFTLTGGNFSGLLESTAAQNTLGRLAGIASITIQGSVAAEGIIRAGGAITKVAVNKGNFAGLVESQAATTALNKTLAIGGMTVQGSVASTGVIRAAGAIGAVSATAGNFAGMLESRATADILGKTPGIASLTVKGDLVAGAKVFSGGQVKTLSVSGAAAGTGETPQTMVQALAKSFGSIQIGGNVNFARLLAGADLGPDWSLDGIEDTFSAGTIDLISIKGSVASSLLGAGLTPKADGFDLVWDGSFLAGSWIKSVDIKGPLGPTIVAAIPYGLGAAKFTGSVRIAGKPVNPSTPDDLIVQGI